MNKEENEMKIRRYTPNTENQCREAGKYIIKLQNNWNELKGWLEENWKESQDIWFVKIINKMQELESRK